MTRYRTIVADPPWDHSDGTGVDLRGCGRLTHLPYGTMTLDAIRSLPVRELSDNVGEDAHLYLWTTSRYLPEAFSVAAGWGFHYAATLIWCKRSRGWSTGGTYQNNVEFVLFCKRPGLTVRPDALAVTRHLYDLARDRGVSMDEINEQMGTKRMAMWWVSKTPTMCAVPQWDQWVRLKEILGAGDEMDDLVRELNARKGTERKDAPQAATTRWFEWPRGAHSAKPEAFLDLVEQVSPGPYLELFARRQRLGWDTWGNEALEHVSLTPEDERVVRGGGAA